MKKLNESTNIIKDFIANKKGITLIALIITIIILLILLGITINLSIGDRGIIRQAKKSTNETNKEQALEELRLIILETQTEKEGKAKVINVVRKLNHNKEYFILGEEETSTGCNIEELNEDISQIYVLHRSYKIKIDDKLNAKLIGIEDSIQLSELQMILKDCNLSTSYTNQDLKDNKDDILPIVLSNEKGAEYVLKNDEICKNIDLDYILDAEFITNTSENNKSLIRDKSYMLEAITNKDNASELLNSLNFTASVPILNKSDDCVFSSIYTNEECWPRFAYDCNDNTYWCTEYNKQNGAYLGYNFYTKKKIYYASIKNGNLRYGTNERCKEVILQCSNEDDNWIDASEVITLQDNGNLSYIVNTKVTEEYSKWRIYIKSSYGSYSSTREANFYGIQ